MGQKGEMGMQGSGQGMECILGLGGHKTLVVSLNISTRMGICKEKSLDGEGGRYVGEYEGIREGGSLRLTWILETSVGYINALCITRGS